MEKISSGFRFSGELNAKGQKDGRGVLISPAGGVVTLAYWEGGERHGPGVMCYGDGEVGVTEYWRGELVGEGTGPVMKSEPKKI